MRDDFVAPMGPVPAGGVARRLHQGVSEDALRHCDAEATREERTQGKSHTRQNICDFDRHKHNAMTLSIFGGTSQSRGCGLPLGTNEILIFCVLFLSNKRRSAPCQTLLSCLLFLLMVTCMCVSCCGTSFVSVLRCAVKLHASFTHIG